MTAKEIAKELNISAAAVSMALNNKPGVSTATRKRVFETAKKWAMTFQAKIPMNRIKYQDIYHLSYIRNMVRL